MSPPRIMFNDGSRIMQDDGAHVTAAPPSGDGPHRPSPRSSARGDVPLGAYYEVDRVAVEAVDGLDWSGCAARGRLLERISAVVGGGREPLDSAAGDVGAAERGRGAEENDGGDGFLCRVALQFPDDLLEDAPEVTWILETAVVEAYKERLMGPLRNAGLEDGTELLRLDDETQLVLDRHLAHPPLLFVLGDTTYGSCCPDEVAANHLDADVIVHYGYACLSPTESIPVIYAFGVSSVGAGDDEVWKECVRLASEEACKGGSYETTSRETSADDDQGKERHGRLLILYEVRYQHAMRELKSAFDETGQFQVVLGVIPTQKLRASKADGTQRAGGRSVKCGGSGGCSFGAVGGLASKNSCCYSDGGRQSNQSCQKGESSCHEAGDFSPRGLPSGQLAEETKDATKQHHIEKQHIPRTLGGLEIPDDLDLSQYTLLYIGDNLNIDSQDSNSSLLHILLRCSAPDGPLSTWSYLPLHRRLNTDMLNTPLSPTHSTPLSSVLSRMLRRRYFLLNKAKLASTIAILIGTTSNTYAFRTLLSRTRDRIRSTGRTAYTFAVGKLSSSATKLANFAEIDCFVLIACSESIAKFWQTERDEMLVPVLTPLELDVALGFREWDGRYSWDIGDLVRWDEADGIVDEVQNDDSVCEGIPRLGNIEHDADSDKNGSDDDEPFFSMISGKYEQPRSIPTHKQNAMGGANLEALPGQGKLIEYRSSAAEYLKKREYKGLEANIGKTEAKMAVLGRVGIASNYGEKLIK